MKTIPRLLASLAVVCAMSTAFAASKPVPPLPDTVPGSDTLLLGIHTVRKELGVTSLQGALLDSIRKEYREEARKVVARAGDTVESKKAAQLKLDALTDSFDKRSLSVLNTKQRQRLAEIEHQMLGGYMLLSPAVQRELNLTSKQKDKLAVIYHKGRAYVSKVNRWFEEGSVSYNERLLYLREDRLDRAEDMLDVLTKEQREKFEKLGGSKFIG
jgi:hypothetical protein